MSAEIISHIGDIVTVRITGLLTPPDLSRLRASIVAALHPPGSARLLVSVEDFQGWQPDSEWADVSDMDDDSYIRKMAIVGPKHWEDLVLVFTARGLRPFPIEYFQHSDLARARAWLMAD
jgi:hypothetical protein